MSTYSVEVNKGRHEVNFAPHHLRVICQACGAFKGSFCRNLRGEKLEKRSHSVRSRDSRPLR